MYRAPQMPLLRTQVYLTAQQSRRLDARRKGEGKTLAGVVRDAIDYYLEKKKPTDLRKGLDATFGVAPEFRAPFRDEWGQRARRQKRFGG